MLKESSSVVLASLHSSCTWMSHIPWVASDSCPGGHFIQPVTGGAQQDTSSGTGESQSWRSHQLCRGVTNIRQEIHT